VEEELSMVSELVAQSDLAREEVKAWVNGIQVHVVYPVE